jgi:hypothetical protein
LASGALREFSPSGQVWLLSGLPEPSLRLMN